MNKRLAGHIVAAFATFFVALAALLLAGCEGLPFSLSGGGAPSTTAPSWFDPSSVPAYDGDPSVEVNGNEPFFEAADFARGAFEEYSPLDARGRCGTAFALIGEETMPDEQRGDIGSVHPSGWQYDQYDWVDQKYLYNRCHLIGWQLAGENANELNLITGTRSMNTLGMLPYENRIAWYVQGTGNHVLYRVTPVFEGSNRVASGVLMEAESVEDNGRGVRYCVWCYNVEPGVRIDYATGKSQADGTIMPGAPESGSSTQATGDQVEETPVVPADEFRAAESEAAYILNLGTGKFHAPHCPSVADMKEHNKFPFKGTREEALELGYKPCGVCKP